MIRKRRPVSQAGTFNGIGGKVEQGESPADAMVRECFEESGIETLPLQWQHNVTLYGADHTCYFYDLFVEEIPPFVQKTDEELFICSIEAVLKMQVPTMSNMQYIFALQFTEDLDLPVKLFKSR